MSLYSLLPTSCSQDLSQWPPHGTEEPGTGGLRWLEGHPLAPWTVGARVRKRTQVSKLGTLAPTGGSTSYVDTNFIFQIKCSLATHRHRILFLISPLCDGAHGNLPPAAVTQGPQESLRQTQRPANLARGPDKGHPWPRVQSLGFLSYCGDAGTCGLSRQTAVGEGCSRARNTLGLGAAVWARGQHGWARLFSPGECKLRAKRPVPAYFGK